MIRSQHRDIAMAFEAHALYPHLTAFENISSAAYTRRIQ